MQELARAHCTQIMLNQPSFLERVTGLGVFLVSAKETGLQYFCGLKPVVWIIKPGGLDNHVPLV